MSSTLSQPTVSSDDSEQLPSAVAVLNVDGMMCAGCARTVETQLLQCDGVATAAVNLVTKAAAVQYQAERVEPEQFATMLTEAGFPSQLRQGEALGNWAERQVAEQEGQGWRIAIALTLLLFSILGHLHHIGSPDNRFTLPVLTTLWFHGILATLTLIFPARGILQDGWKGIQRVRPNMNTLVSIGALGAYITSVMALVLPKLGWECFFDEPVMLLSFILLGRTLEERARFRATEALRGLLALQPNDANLVTGQDAGKTIAVPMAQVQVGDVLQVLPGDKIPVDGQIEQGRTTVNEAMVTGESLPVTKQVGDPVIGGTLNQSGTITVKVDRTGADSTLAQMINLVEAAQTRKAPIQGLADTLSGYFTYGILSLALVTFLFWYTTGLTIWPDAAQAALNAHHAHGDHLLNTSRLLVSLKLAIAVIVIACPCALGLATPMAILVGSGIGSQRGLLVRGGDVLETAHHLDTIIFDKTGTLTTGQPWVTDCLSYDPNFTEDDVLQLAASIEQDTRHPLASAILTTAAQRQLPLTHGTDSVTVPGLGVTAKLAEKSVHLGNETWLAQADITTDVARDAATTLSAAGKTLVYVAVDAQLVGLIAIADRPREEAIAVIEQLKANDLQVQLLSGDRPGVVHRLATELGISLAAGQMTPADKVSVIEKLQQAGHRVGFVGDGINDAPALAQADVGLALHSGTEIAMETADIVLMGDNLTDVIAALELSRSTFNKIRQNLAWAFGYNLVCIPLAAGILLPRFGLALSPGVAGGFMAFSSIGVVLNSLLLRWQLRARA